MIDNAFVYVIESPSGQDLLDGRTEGRLLSESLKLAEIPYWYSLASDRTMFREALGARLMEAWEKHARLPILHLSMHGNSDGVQLTSGEFITWDELRSELLPLMGAMQGGLLVCMSSCFGGAGCRMAMHNDDEAHFWALVGNTQSALWSDAAIGYASFYHLFFKGFDLEVCVNSMRVASADHNFVHFIGAETKQNWEAYLRDQRQEQLDRAVQEAADSVLQKYRTE